MSDNKWEPMTAEQKLGLAIEVVNLIEETYPIEQFDGQADALVMAIQAITSVNFSRTVLFGAAQ